jgi:nucleoside-diphosphate-sugar epimerase/lipopolysaccharide/colanic/teichoic acid biosynthesis glycosyltransferase
MRARIVQIAVAMVAIVVTVPLVAVLALASACAFRAWPFFRQPRVGLGGRRFTLVKIRTLPKGTAASAPKYELSPESAGRVGRLLRRTHLDELPQLWLVLLGSMALVGPRPEMPDLAAGFAPDFAARRTSVRPGCTGLWQVSPAADGLIGEAPEYDLFYVQHASARLDLWILWRTIVSFFRPARRAVLADVPRWARRAEPGDERPAPSLVRAPVPVFTFLPAIDPRPVEPAQALSGPVLVAGAGGFIGGHAVARLLDAGFDVRAVDSKPLDEWHQLHPSADTLVADLSDAAACRDLVRDMRTVLNFAADMGGMGFIEHNKARCMLSVLINTHLLLAAKEQHVARYFFASSACVYRADKQNNPQVTALREEDAYPASPEDGYGWEKLFSERMCRHFREDFGVPTRLARLHNVYGPRGTYDAGREKAPAAICRKVAEAVLSGRDTIDIWGDGHQTRSFTYIDDCIEGVLRLTCSDVFEPINIGSSELVSVNELVDIVEDIAGVKLLRNYQLDAPQGVRGRNSDNERIRRLLGWEPNTPLRTGMEATYRWVYEQVAAHAGERTPV